MTHFNDSVYATVGFTLNVVNDFRWFLRQPIVMKFYKHYCLVSGATTSLNISLTNIV